MSDRLASNRWKPSPGQGKPPIHYGWYRDFIELLYDGGHHVWFAKLVVYVESWWELPWFWALSTASPPPWGADEFELPAGGHSQFQPGTVRSCRHVTIGTGKSVHPARATMGNRP